MSKLKVDLHKNEKNISFGFEIYFFGSAVLVYLIFSLKAGFLFKKISILENLVGKLKSTAVISCSLTLLAFHSPCVPCSPS